MSDLKALRDEMATRAKDAYDSGEYEAACTTNELQAYADSLTSIIEQQEKERLAARDAISLWGVYIESDCGHHEYRAFTVALETLRGLTERERRT